MKQFTCTTQTQQGDKGEFLNVTLTGNLTLHSAKEIRDSLAKINSNFESMIITAKDVESIDVSFIQILEAFRKQNITNGANVKVFMDLPYNIKTLLANAGIAYPSK